MNKLLLLAAVLFLAAAQAQQITDKDKLVYLDSLGRETTNSNQAYFRIIKDYHTDAAEYKIFDYYKSGKIKSESSSKDKATLRRTGKVTEYFENGNKDSEFFIGDDYHCRGKISLWYENGKPKTEGEYIPYNSEQVLGQPYKILQYWDETGTQKVKDGNGYFKEGQYLVSEGNIVDGVKDGVWTGKDTRKNFSYTETYNHGKFVSGVSDADGVKTAYDQLHVKPGPKKGLAHFYKFLSERYAMPRKLTYGKILLSFIVEKDGSISTIKIVKSIDEKMDKEAIRVLKKYPDWQPGLLRGQFVRVQYSLPITIKPE